MGVGVTVGVAVGVGDETVGGDGTLVIGDGAVGTATLGLGLVESGLAGGVGG